MAIKNIYPCSQSRLFTIAEIAWNTHILHIGDFTAFHRSYTVKFYEEMIELIDNAKKIEGKHEPLKEISLKKRHLLTAKNEMMLCYKKLKEYARSEAGHEYLNLFLKPHQYRKACNNHWYTCHHVAFFLKNSSIGLAVKLSENNTLPTDFPSACQTTATNYLNAYKAFCKAQHDATALSAHKVIHCNKIYTHLTAMLRHAQIIYDKNPAMQALFCFDRLLKKQKAAVKSTALKTTTVKIPSAFLNKVAAMF